MLVIKELKKNLFPASVLALGVFDGVHIAHRRVIEQAVENAAQMGICSVIVTFSTHPRFLISGSMPSIITSLEERLALFEGLGADAAVVIDFNKNIAKMTAEEYLQKILTGCLNAKSLSIGYNHQFGSDKKGTGDFLKEYCAENHIQLNIIPPVKINNHTVSSSVIRRFILSGDVTSAMEFLGRPFKIKGEVIKGKQLGRQLGFPTANLIAPERLIVPLRGVYAGSVRLDNNIYRAVINIDKIIEAHILDFDRDIYGETIEVSFLERIRDEKKFDSPEELKKQIQIDYGSVERINR